MRRKRWFIRSDKVPKRENLLDFLLEIRGIEDKEAFLDPQLSYIYSFYKLKGVKEAVERLKRAIDKKEKVGLYIDYDVDGITGGAILYRNLKKLGVDVEVKIPNRLSEGYGVQISGLKELREKGVSLVITVDSGIRSFEAAEWAFKNNLDLIITDHHFPSKDLPKALAIINPHLDYPFRFLSGVGVVFKFLLALYEKMGQDPKELIWDLDLVVLGTVADIVPLISENRVLSYLGMKVLEKSKKMGIKVLKKISGREENLRTWDILFVLAPRLNAAGRLQDASLSFNLLVTKKTEEALKLAKMLEKMNSLRMEEQERILAGALSTIEKEDKGKNFFITIKGKDFHPGVIGIVASKIAEKYYRPSIVFTEQGDILRGSARSINKNIDLMEIFDKLDDLILEYGGHSCAAGIKILKKDYEVFEEKINLLASINFKEEDFEPEVTIDCKFPIEEWDSFLYSEVIEKMEPFGEGNPKPVFLDENLTCVGDIKLRKNEHLDFYVIKKGRFFRAFVPERFDLYDKIVSGKTKISAVYSPEIDYYSKRKDLSFKILDLEIINEKF
ncbi:MAG: single-stranded-DNA-specific exonuclease RecJ [Candidatus Hydrothermales bacterium]